MSYAKALEKLESLPPDEQELASGMYVFEMRDGKPHCGCAIGKLLTEEQRAELVKCASNSGTVGTLKAWIGISYDTPFDDMTSTEAVSLQIFNDEAATTPPGLGEANTDAARKERYLLVIDWLRKQVAVVRP